MKKERLLQNPWIVCVLALVCCTLWGSAFSVIKIGYEIFDIASEDTGAQILFAGMRFTLAGILAILFGSLLERRFLFPKKSSWDKVVRLCMLQTVIQYLFFYVGVAHTTGVSSAIMTGTNSLWVILIAGLIFHQEKLEGPKIAGCILGFAGVVIANLGTASGGVGMSFNGEGFLLISSVSYAFSAVCLKRYSKDENPVTLSGYQFVVGGIILMIISAFMGGRLNNISPAGLGILLYLAFLSAVAYSLWGILLKYNPASKVAIYGFTNPVIGVLMSAVLLGEGSQALSVKNLMALFLVSAGVLVVNLFGTKGKKPGV